MNWLLGWVVRIFGSSIGTLLIAIFVALVVRSLAFEPFNIPSGSMKPNLLVGDYLFVSKYSYGYSRYSFPFKMIPLSGRIFEDIPERGDIAVFKYPPDPSTDYIKRIVGLPGDSIQVINEVLYINGEPVLREMIGERRDRDHRGVTHTFEVWREKLPDGTSWDVYESTPRGPLDNTDVYQVPEGNYFAMGDNRDHSADSRLLSGVGYIPAENLVGRAKVLFLSVDGDASLWEFWRWPWTIRFSRIGDSL